MMNSIEERDNLIGLLQKALEFYASRDNYKGHPSASTCGTPTSLVEMDEGTQARFALEKAQQMTAQNQKMQEDYDRIMSGYEQLQATDGIADVEELIKTFKVMGDGNNNI
jgi:hypothetical protein